MKFFIREDLYVAGRDDDGQEYTASQYYVVAEDDQGRRWAHRDVHAGCRVLVDEEGDRHFSDVRAEALAGARKRLNSFRRHGTALDTRDWDSIPAAYGSDAHSDAEMVEWERAHG